MSARHRPCPTLQGALPLITMYRACRVALTAALLSALCLGLGCQPNAALRRDMNGFLPLHRAVQDNDLAAAEKLLTEHGQANTPDLDGVAPLHRAARHGQLDMCKLLLNHGAEVDQRTRDGWTALHLALWYEHLDVAKLLLSRGASATPALPDGLTPLHMAAKRGMAEAIDVLMMDWPASLASGKPDVDAANSKGVVPLLLAVKSGDKRSISKLLLLGARATVTDDEGNTALHLLAGTDMTSQIKELLARGAAINATNNAGNTPYALAEQMGNARVAALLAAKGGH